MIEGWHFQNAYVTRDIDKAIARFAEQADIGDVKPFDAETVTWTPAGEQAIATRLAFIWIDDMQYELIEPVSGADAIYRDALPDTDDRLQFHHVCKRVTDWDSFRARVDRQPWPVVLERITPELNFLYLDARPLLGHYLEYLWVTDARWAQMGGRAPGAGSS